MGFGVTAQPLFWALQKLTVDLAIASPPRYAFIAVQVLHLDRARPLRLVSRGHAGRADLRRRDPDRRQV